MMKIKNFNVINFIAGRIGVGSTREYCSIPNGHGGLVHEITQFKGSKQHGCSEIYFPVFYFYFNILEFFLKVNLKI